MKESLLSVILFGLCLNAKTQDLNQVSKESGKIHEPGYCLFYDNHTMPALPDVGENFDAELFTDRLKDCGVDYLTFHARCNLGMAYYNT